MKIMNSKTDVRNWVDAHLASESDEETAKLVDAILDGDHPLYGDDWSDYLDEMFPQKGWIEKKAEILGWTH